MTAITICSDFGGQEKSLSLFPLFPHHFAWSDGSRCHNLSIFECWVLSQLFTLLLHFPQEDLQFLFTFCHKGGVICIPEIIDIFPAILIPACDLSSLAFCIMYSAYRLNKQGDNTQPWRIPFPIWKQSIVPCPVLTVASWPEYRFFRRQVRWSGIPVSLRIFHSLWWFT